MCVSVHVSACFEGLVSVRPSGDVGLAWSGRSNMLRLTPAWHHVTMILACLEDLMRSDFLFLWQSHKSFGVFHRAHPHVFRGCPDHQSRIHCCILCLSSPVSFSWPPTLWFPDVARVARLCRELLVVLVACGEASAPFAWARL